MPPEIRLDLIPDSPGSPQEHLMSGGNYAKANATNCSTCFDVPDAVGCCSVESGSHKHGARSLRGRSHALHGCSGAERGRAAARRNETGARIVIRGKN